MELTRQALALGHTVTAVVRGPIRLPMSHEQLRVVKATFTDEDAITKALGGQEAVLSGVGAPLSRAPTCVHEDSARAILAAMTKTGVQRFLAVTSGGTSPQHEPNLPFVFEQLFKRLFSNIYNDQIRMEQAIMASTVDWTIVRPAQLTDEPVSNRYRFAEGYALPKGNTTARADVAHFMLNHIVDKATFRKGIAIAY